MKRFILLGLLVLAASIGTQAQVYALPKFVSALPSSCSPTSSQQVLVYKYTLPRGVYYCSATGTYTPAGGSGGGVISAMLAPDGTALAPSYSFTNSPTTGFFRSAADAIGVSTAGTERWTFNASGALNPLVSKTYDIGGSTTIRDIGIGRNAIFSGATSGTTTVQATATAGSTTLTLPAATDTLVGKATTDTLTNKTFDTAGTGNSFSINGVAATANTGTGAVVRAASPTFTGTVALPTSVTVNGNAETFPTSAKTLMATDYSNAGTAPGAVIAVAVAVNFNAVADTAMAITLPSGFTRYRVQLALISHASASITTATVGMFTATGGGGSVIVTSGSAVTVNTASESTVNNMQSLAIGNISTEDYNNATLYFRVTNAQGSAATADVTLFLQPLP